MTTTGSTAQQLDATWSSSLVSLRTPAEQLVLTAYEKSSLTLEEYATKVINYSKSLAELARKAAISRRVQILRDAWGPLLKASFENWVTPEVAEAVLGSGKDHLDISRNPAKIIWQELAITYKSPAKRHTPSDVSDGEKYNALLEGTFFDLFWQMVEIYLEACNEVLIWPDIITSRGKKKIKHRCAVGNVVTIVTTEEDPTEIEAVLITDEYKDLDGQKHKKYILWTNEWHAQFEETSDGKYKRTGYINPDLVPEDNDPTRDNSAINPYGEIPMYLIRLNPWTDSIWDQTSGEDLIDLTLRGGEDRLLYRYMQKMSGFKQGVATGADIDTMPKQLLDPAFLLKILGQDVSFQLVDWTVDLKARLECMLSDELAAAASRGINPERYKKTANYQTTFGARIAERGLAERRIRNSPIFKEAEKEYKRKLCVIAQAHGLEDVPDPEVVLDIEHMPQSYPEDPSSQIMVEGQELSLGLESPITLLKRRHPEWTDEEAREALKTYLEDIAWVNDMKTTHNIANNPFNESASAEENGKLGPMVRDNRQPPGSFGSVKPKFEKE